MPTGPITVTELLAAIDAGAAGARKTGPAWARLREIVAALDPGVASSDLAGRSWQLAEICLAGFQGAAEDDEVVLALDPGPGLTVVHGHNGAGKSTVANAIRAAARATLETTSRRGVRQSKNDPLWVGPYRALGAAEGTVHATLRSTSDPTTLTVTTAVNDEEAINNNAVVGWTGIVHRPDGTERPVTAAEWRALTSSSLPVVSYAEVERDVRTSGELHELLDRLLVLGPLFATVADQVEAAAADSQHADRAFSTGLRAAKAAVAEVDGRFQREAAITWPRPADDPDTWLGDHGLDGIGTGRAAVTDDTLKGVHDAAAAVHTGLAARRMLRDDLQTRLRGPLGALAAEAQERDDPGRTCPVCATDDVDWLAALARTLAGTPEADELTRCDDAVAEAVRGLRVVVDAELGLIDAALHASGGLPPTGNRLMVAFRSAVDADGPRTHRAVLAAEQLADWLVGDGVIVAGLARRESDVEHTWNRERRTAVDPFIALWRDEGSAAAAHDLWRDVTSLLKGVESTLAARRRSALTAASADGVRSLLGDLGLALKDIELGRSTATLELTDATGENLPTTVLSAGQRNACLLAPLLTASAHGVFGFFVIDDPVHSFDEIRVAALARLLRSMSSDLRVVVLTHDARLHDHLLDVDRVQSLTVTRNAGVVQLESQAPMWKTLLEDAGALLSLVSGSQQTGTADIVFALCRGALDDGIRRLVIAHASACGTDPESALRDLDQALHTGARLVWTRAFVNSCSTHAQRLARAETTLGKHLAVWSTGAHGQAGAVGKKALMAEIDVAWEACGQLIGAVGS